MKKNITATAMAIPLAPTVFASAASAPGQPPAGPWG